MRASAFVGRVGGLALALGVGAVVGSLSHGVAAASPSDSSSATDSAVSTSGSDRRVERSQGSRSKQGQGTQSATSSTRAGRAKAAAESLDTPATALKSSNSVALPVNAAAAVPVPSPAPATSGGFRTPVPTVAAQPPLAQSTAAMSSQAPAEAVGATAEPVTVAAAQPVAAAGLVESAVSLVPGSDPSGPAESPFSWTLLAAARRQIGAPAQAAASVVAAAATEANSVPTLKRVLVGTPYMNDGWSVSGDVVVVDPDTDPLRYTVGATFVRKDPDGFMRYLTGGGGFLWVSGEGGEVTFYYTPGERERHAASVPGDDQSETFFLTFTDGRGGSLRVPVTVPITPFNQAPEVTKVSVNSPSAGGVVSGRVQATDADGDTLTYSGTTTTKKGSVTVSSTGGFTYTPTAAARHGAAQTGATSAKTDSFTVTITDGHGGMTYSVVTVDIAPKNTAPTVKLQQVSSPDPKTGVVTGTVAGSDADNDPLVYSAPGKTSKGSISINASTGAFTYTPSLSALSNAAKPNATTSDKTDTFIITVKDGYTNTDGTDSYSVTNVTVGILSTGKITNRAPVIDKVSIGTPTVEGKVGGSITVTELDNDKLTYSISGSGNKGSATITNFGTFTYTPTMAARHAAAKIGAKDDVKMDTFTINVSDGKGGKASTLVTVSISPYNTPPVVTSTKVNSPNASTGVVTGSVVAQDSEKDFLIYSAPATSKGTVKFAAGSGGAFTYTPTAAARQNANRAGATAEDKSDSFTVTIADGYGGSTTRLVTVKIV